MKHQRIAKISALSAGLLILISLVFLFYITQSSSAKNDAATVKDTTVKASNADREPYLSFSQFNKLMGEGAFAFPYSPLFSFEDYKTLESHPAKEALEYSVKHQYLSAFADHTLQPESNLRRLDFLSSLLTVARQNKIFRVGPLAEDTKHNILSNYTTASIQEILLELSRYGLMIPVVSEEHLQQPIPMGEAISLWIQFLQKHSPESLSTGVSLTDYLKHAFSLRFSPYYMEFEGAIGNGIVAVQDFSPEEPCKRWQFADLIYRGLEPNRRFVNPRLIKESLSGSHDDYQSQSIALFNYESKQFIWQKDSHVKRSPASLTKIMTVLVAIEHIDNLKERTYVSDKYRKQMRRQGAKLAGFYSYEKVSYEDLLYATLLSSGAEAAGTLAVRLAGKESIFIDWMNEKAKELGMYNTQFKTVEGLDKEGQYTTAGDIVLLLEYALQNPTFYQVFTSSTYRTSRNRQHPRGLYLESTVLSSLTAEDMTTFQIIGGKSGTTSEAGLCWATLGIKEDTPYILVTLGAPLDNILSPTMTQKQDALKIYERLLPKSIAN